MKKILSSTIVLTAFAISITLFEISCKKSANAQSPSYVLPVATASRLGGVIPDGTTISVDGNGKISANTNSSQQQNKILYKEYANGNGSESLWTANSDGTNPKKINIVLPTGLGIGDNITISPDRKTIFFDTYTVTGDLINFIYACNIDGSNVHKIITPNTGGDVSVMAAY